MKLNPKSKNIFKKVFIIVDCSLSLIGLIFIGVLVAMQFGLLNVKGSISQRNSYFNVQKDSSSNLKNSNKDDFEIICKINVLNKYAPSTSINIYRTLLKSNNNVLANQMINLASRRFENNSSYKKDIDGCLSLSYQAISTPVVAYGWAESDMWQLLKDVFVRDQTIITKASKDAGISPRLALSGVIGEQFRFFSSKREVFKSYFEPMKMLMSLSKSSFGIGGLKVETVEQIENNLKNPKSPFYLGPDMEHVADYPAGVDVASERMNRITDAKNPYYSYLYIGLYMRQIETQWQRSGYDISERPDVLATLYNLGFYRSVPKAEPEAGGAVISVDGTDYTFGDLGYEFYYSGELSDTFPLGV